MSRSRRRRNKKSYFYNFIPIPRKMLWKCDEWKELSPAAKLLYIHVKGKWNGYNNGQIRLYYSELKGFRGISADSTISKASKELQEKGWIKRTKLGGLHRYFNEYELTGKYDDHI